MHPLKGHFRYQLLFFSCLFLAILGTDQVFGQTNTWNSTTGNWSDGTRWSLGIPPTAAHDVVVPDINIAYTLTLDVSTTIKSLTLGSGDRNTALVFSGANSLTVTEGVSIGNGSGAGDNKTLGVDAGSLSCASISIIATAAANRTSRVRISTGTVTVTGNITMGANNFVAFSDTGTLNIGGTGTMSGGTLTPSTGTVNYTGTNQTIGSYTYNNLTLSGSGTKTAASGRTINGNFTLATGVTFAAGAFTHTIAGNWINNGGTFTNTGSTINLNGGAQSIGGTSATTFNNLTLAGSNTKTFNFSTTINGTLALSGTAIANLGAFTTHTANSLIMDGVSRAAGTWGSSSSVATNQDDTNFSSSGHITIATFPPTITAVSNGNWTTASTWSCNCVPPANSNVTIPVGITVTIPFPAVDHRNATNVIITVNGTLVINSASLYIDAGDQLIVNTGGQLVSAGLLGGSIATGPFAFPYILSPLGPPFGADNFNSGTTIDGPVSIIGGALPITLLYFTGRQFEKEVVLEWASATEENFDYYRIEKSLDGAKFEELNRVKGSEFSNEKKEYSLVDPFPVSGKIYYRLVAVDLDGSSEQFQVILVDFKVDEKRIYAYPNPVSQGEYLVVQPNFRIAEGDAIIVYNNLGQSLFQTTFINSLPISIETQSWEPGMYFLNIYSKEGRFIEKVVVR